MDIGAILTIICPHKLRCNWRLTSLYKVPPWNFHCQTMAVQCSFILVQKVRGMDGTAMVSTSFHPRPCLGLYDLHEIASDFGKKCFDIAFFVS